jgi:predicted TIM-barrel fold metal-dependent hydrolase
VACEADEELPFLVRFIGEDKIIIGSDYGHNDPSKEPEFIKNMRAREDVPPALVEKILCLNARQLYGLS